MEWSFCGKNDTAKGSLEYIGSLLTMKQHFTISSDRREPFQLILHNPWYKYMKYLYSYSFWKSLCTRTATPVHTSPSQFRATNLVKKKCSSGYWQIPSWERYCINIIIYKVSNNFFDQTLNGYGTAVHKCIFIRQLPLSLTTLEIILQGFEILEILEIFRNLYLVEK